MRFRKEDAEDAFLTAAEGNRPEFARTNLHADERLAHADDLGQFPRRQRCAIFPSKISDSRCTISGSLTRGLAPLRCCPLPIGHVHNYASNLRIETGPSRAASNCPTNERWRSSAANRIVDTQELSPPETDLRHTPQQIVSHLTGRANLRPNTCSFEASR